MALSYDNDDDNNNNNNINNNSGGREHDSDLPERAQAVFVRVRSLRA